MDFEKLKLKEYENWDVYLHPRQYYLGRLYVWAKRDNSKDFIEDMTDNEKSEFFDIAKKVKKAVSESFHPDLFNYASLCNDAKHLHVHFIPRYNTPRIYDGITFIDENAGKNYSPYDMTFSISEETLYKIRDEIKSKL